jgi:N-acetylneuraminic acid mutarotase
MAYLGNLPLSDGAAALELLFAQKSDIDHRHSISDVDGLADALAGGGGGGGDIPYATTSVAGKIRIATSTDTTSNDKAVTPASMANFVNNAINNIGDYNGVYGSGVYTIFKTPGVSTFNTPAGVTEARVTVIGPGGNGIDPINGAVAAGGGGGGFAQGIYPVSGSYNVTVGTPGSSSSFGTLLSATSGENGASVNGNLVGGNGGNGIGGNLVNRRGGRGSGGPMAPAEYINFTELPTGSGTIPSGVTTVTMIGKGGPSNNPINTDNLGNGSGKPWVQQYSFNETQNSAITGWVSGTALPGTLAYSQAVVTKNRVYLLGGHSGVNGVSTVYTAPINTDGTLGTWTTGTSLPVAYSHSQVAVIKNRVYLFGGDYSPTQPSLIHSTTINPDGTLGTWTAVGSFAGVDILGSQVIVTKNRVYLLGGHNSNGYSSSIYTTSINSDGTLGTWSSVANALPIGLSSSQAVVTKNKVYLLGGEGVGYAQSAIYVAPINPDGTLGTWTTSGNLPKLIGNSHAVVTKNRVYLLGGHNNSDGNLTTIYSAPIDIDGTLGAWTTSGNLLIGIRGGQVIVVNNKIHLLGGENDSNIGAAVYTAPFAGGLNDYTPIIENKTVHRYQGISGTGEIPAGITAITMTGKGGTGTTTNNPGQGLAAYPSGLPAYVAGSPAVAESRTKLCVPYQIDELILAMASGSSLIRFKDYASGYILYWDTSLNGYDYSNLTIPFSYSTDQGSTWSTIFLTGAIDTVIDGISFTDTTGELVSHAINGVAIRYQHGQYSGQAGSPATPEVGNASYPSGLPPYVAASQTETRGTSTTVTVSGTTYTFIGGMGGPASWVTHTATLTGSSATPYTYNATGTDAVLEVEYANLAQSSSGVLNLSNVSGNGSLPSDVTSVVLSGKGGDAVASGSVYGSGKPWVQQYDFNDLQNTDITGWTTGTSLPGALYYSQAVVTKNRVYLLGGYNGAAVSTVYTAPINTDGTLGTWTTGTSLPGALCYSQAVVTKNRVYLLGGHGNSIIVSTVYTAPINTDGTLGTWTTGTSLPGALAYPQAVVTKNRVYLLGGFDGSSIVSTVYTAPINTDGTLGTWTTGGSLPGNLGYSQAVVIGNRVYLLGGYNGSSIVSTVYTAPINTDGTLGTWTTGTSLPDALSYPQAVVTKNRVYLLGGQGSSSIVSTVYTAPINTDGTLGTWTTGTSLPGALCFSQAVVTKNRVYLLGADPSTVVSTVYTASFAGGLNDYTDVVANGDDGTLLLNGTASTITFNGTTYTFPGGSSLLPAVTTTFNVSLPGTTAAAYSYTKPTVGTELSITYSSSSIGAPTTITVNGVVYTFPGGVNGPAVQSIQNAYLTGNAAVNYSYNIAPGGLGAISYQVAGGGGGAGGSDSGGTGGGASGCYSEAFMRDAYGNNGGGFGNGMDTSVTTSGVTSVAHNFSGGGGNNSSTGGGKGGIGGGGGGGAIGGNGLVIVEW